MLDGARCVGKSYIAEEFARNEGYMGEGKYQILWCGVNATILSSQKTPKPATAVFVFAPLAAGLSVR